MRKKIVQMMLLLTLLVSVVGGAERVQAATASGPSAPEFYVGYEGSEQSKVCNGCSLVDLGVIVHMSPTTTLPLYVRFSTTYIPISDGLKWTNVAAEGCVEILNQGVVPGGKFDVYAKVTCRPATGHNIVAVRYQPLAAKEWPISYTFTDSGNWDLRHDQSLTAKVKEKPWISNVEPGTFAPEQTIKLTGQFDTYADQAMVAFRTGNSVPADIGGILDMTATTMTVAVPSKFGFPITWPWRVFVLFKEKEESDLEWRMSNWVDVTITNNRMYLPFVIR